MCNGGVERGCHCVGLVANGACAVERVPPLLFGPARVMWATAVDDVMAAGVVVCSEGRRVIPKVEPSFGALDAWVR